MVSLIADIGGTKTQVALVNEQHQILEKALFENTRFSSFEALLEFFLPKSVCSSEHSQQRAVVAVAGPIKDQRRCEMTNLKWVIQTDRLAAFGFTEVKLLNDLEATAWGMGCPEVQRKLEFVQGNELNFNAPIAVVSVGTGLGEACILPGQPRRILASEGGHKNLAPFNPLSATLIEQHWQHHQQPYSLEKWFSGSGMARLYQAMHPLAAAITNAEISRIALRDSQSKEAQCLDLFTQGIYAAAGDTVLQWLAWGGLIIAGGVPGKIPAFFRKPENLRYLHWKSEYAALLAQVPVSLCFDQQAPLTGALEYLKQDLNGF